MHSSVTTAVTVVLQSLPNLTLTCSLLVLVGLYAICFSLNRTWHYRYVCFCPCQLHIFTVLNSTVFHCYGENVI